MSRCTRYRRPIPDILVQHADDAAHHLESRQGFAESAHVRLAHLDESDARIQADIDALVIAQEAGLHAAAEACLHRLSQGTTFAVASLSHLTGRTPAQASRIAPKLPANQEAWSGLIDAAAWHGGMPSSWLTAALSPTDTLRLRLAIAAERRQTDAVQAADLTASQPPAVLARAIQAVGELGRVDLYAASRPHLASDDITVRFWTAWTLALRTASGESRKTLQWFASATSPHAELATITVARRLVPADAQAWIDQLAVTHPRLAIQAAGAAGDPVRLPWLLERCTGPALARVAGEAISLITGVDLAYLDLDGDQPAGFTPPGPTDDPADPTVDGDPDEHLPWPDAAKLSRWLGKQSFPVGTRHLCGKPIDAAGCTQVLRDGYQRQRLAAAYELAAIDLAAPLFNTAAPAWMQRKLLG